MNMSVGHFESVKPIDAPALVSRRVAGRRSGAKAVVADRPAGYLGIIISCMIRP